ncbi:MAG: 3-dehydro-scyllo-inosose hydrolase [candidate division NC10 bacterium]|nr:3-dehydro-scyllo-inosose hydrolase [candidate division NC10 bacterium]
MGKWTLPPTGGHMDKPSKIYFQTMTKYDVEERLKQNDLIVIPLGSTENHGAAGPYGEDTFIVTRIAEEFAKATGCTVAHPICYGSHPYHHLGQPGTVIISDDVYSDFLRAVMAGFWNTGFRKQIFISLHGQEYIVPSAINEFGKRYQVPALIIFLDVPRIMGQTLMDKAHGGPYDNPFQHACEAETSISLALFPEMVQMEHAEDTTVRGFLPPGHVDRGGDIYGNPIPGHCQIGCGGIECVVYPEGVLGKATLADPKKAIKSIEVTLDYMKKLHDDIFAKFPVGVLPDTKLITRRPKEEIDALRKGPLNGGRHLYTLGFPA